MDIVIRDKIVDKPIREVSRWANGEGGRAKVSLYIDGNTTGLIPVEVLGWRDCRYMHPWQAVDFVVRVRRTRGAWRAGEVIFGQHICARVGRGLVQTICVMDVPWLEATRRVEDERFDGSRSSLVIGHRPSGKWVGTVIRYPGWYVGLGDSGEYLDGPYGDHPGGVPHFYVSVRAVVLAFAVSGGWDWGKLFVGVLKQSTAAEVAGGALAWKVVR